MQLVKLYIQISAGLIGAIEDCDRLAGYPFYPAAPGELELRRGRHNAARKHFRAALGLSPNPMERQFLKQRVGACERGDPPEPAILGPATRLQGEVTS